MASDYDVLIALEDIFKVDVLTKGYVIQAAEEPDNLPSPDICPMINILPISKLRELRRMSTTPYISQLQFNILLWEMSAGDFKNAFQLMHSMEKNVYQVLLANKNVNGNVLTSVIGDTTYDYIFYENTFYIKGVIPFLMQQDQ